MQQSKNIRDQRSAFFITDLISNLTYLASLDNESKSLLIITWKSDKVLVSCSLSHFLFKFKT